MRECGRGGEERLDVVVVVACVRACVWVEEGEREGCGGGVGGGGKGGGRGRGGKSNAPPPPSQETEARNKTHTMILDRAISTSPKKHGNCKGVGIGQKKFCGLSALGVFSARFRLHVSPPQSRTRIPISRAVQAFQCREIHTKKKTM